MKNKASKKDSAIRQPLSGPELLAELDKIIRSRLASRTLTVDLAHVLVRRADYLDVRMQANFTVMEEKLDAILTCLRQRHGDSSDCP